MKLSEIMKRASLKRGPSNVILSLSFTDIQSGKDMKEIYSYALSFVNKMPENSMKLLFDLRGLGTGTEIEEHLQQMTMDCCKYFRASAIVVDTITEETMKSIARKLGLTKMITYHDIGIANEYLFND